MNEKVKCPVCRGLKYTCLKSSPTFIGMNNESAMYSICREYNFFSKTWWCSHGLASPYHTCKRCSLCNGKGQIDWIDSLFINNQSYENKNRFKKIIDLILNDKDEIGRKVILYIPLSDDFNMTEFIKRKLLEVIKDE